MSITLEEACSDRRIVRLIVRARLRRGRAQRDALFSRRMVGKGGLPNTVHSSEISPMMPPRSEWPRPGMQRRRAAQVNGNDAMVTVLTEYIMGMWSTRNGAAPGWLRRLRRFVAGIR